MSWSVDIAIVGAGAAGLAAAMRLAGQPLSVAALEARDRVGGRAHTLGAGGFDLDMGCGWLHSADINPFIPIAETLGFPVDRTPPYWSRPPAAGSGSAAQAQADFGRALGELEGRIAQAAARGEDRPVSELMTLGAPLNPMLDAFSAYYNGDEFDQISTLDYDAYQDTEINWRTPRGYGALVAAYGAAAPVSLSTPVTRIDHSGPRLRLETPRGVLEARLVIVAAPTPLIASGALAFAPDLPAARAAAEGLPLGLADKVFLALDDAQAFEADSRLFGALGVTRGAYHMRPFGRPLIEVFLAGRNARALEGQGPDAATAFAIDELVSLLGSDIRRRLTPLAASGWLSDPWSRGAYSHARPGDAGARRALALAGGERILFAGEACSPNFFSTAHGAFLSGVAAAEQALARL